MPPIHIVTRNCIISLYHQIEDETGSLLNWHFSGYMLKLQLFLDLFAIIRWTMTIEFFQHNFFRVFAFPYEMQVMWCIYEWISWESAVRIFLEKNYRYNWTMCILRVHVQIGKQTLRDKSRPSLRILSKVPKWNCIYGNNVFLFRFPLISQSQLPFRF